VPRTGKTAAQQRRQAAQRARVPVSGGGFQPVGEIVERVLRRLDHGGQHAGGSPAATVRNRRGSGA
jgi:hypothetical protein